MVSVVLSDIHKNYLIFQYFIGGSALSGKLSEKANWLKSKTLKHRLLLLQPEKQKKILDFHKDQRLLRPETSTSKTSKSSLQYKCSKLNTDNNIKTSTKIKDYYNTSHNDIT